MPHSLVTVRSRVCLRGRWSSVMSGPSSLSLHSIISSYLLSSPSSLCTSQSDLTSVADQPAAVITLSVMSLIVASIVFDRAFALCCLKQLKDTLCTSFYCYAANAITHYQTFTHTQITIKHSTSPLSFQWFLLLYVLCLLHKTFSLFTFFFWLFLLITKKFHWKKFRIYNLI